jgi:ribulose-phosphate 3-epimerase
MTARICPSILNADRDNLRREIERIETAADWLHLDIMDGLFVPATTFSFEESRRIIAETSLPVDTHLMISNPDEMAKEYARAGSKSVTFHLEASQNPIETLRSIRAHNSRSAVGIKPATPVDTLFDLLDYADMFLIMTVEPGAGGQKYMIDMAPKVKTLRELVSLKKLPTWIQVDGGITLETITHAAGAGANSFVAGSAVYKSEDPALMITQLRELADDAIQGRD